MVDYSKWNNIVVSSSSSSDDDYDDPPRQRSRETAETKINKELEMLKKSKTEIQQQLQDARKEYERLETDLKLVDEKIAVKEKEIPLKTTFSRNFINHSASSLSNADDHRLSSNYLPFDDFNSLFRYYIKNIAVVKELGKLQNFLHGMKAAGNFLKKHSELVCSKGITLVIINGIEFLIGMQFAMAQNVFGQADYMMCILAYSQARDCPIRVSIDLLTKNESRKLFGFHYQLRELTQKVQLDLLLHQIPPIPGFELFPNHVKLYRMRSYIFSGEVFHWEEAYTELYLHYLFPHLT